MKDEKPLWLVPISSIVGITKVFPEKYGFKNILDFKKNGMYSELVLKKNKNFELIFDLVSILFPEKIKREIDDLSGFEEIEDIVNYGWPYKPKGKKFLDESLNSSINVRYGRINQRLGLNLKLEKFTDINYHYKNIGLNSDSKVLWYVDMFYKNLYDFILDDNLEFSIGEEFFLENFLNVRSQISDSLMEKDFEKTIHRVNNSMFRCSITPCLEGKRKYTKRNSTQMDLF
ncbi:MAG: hypothetical protein PF569_00410 [Candidatus Woesearchaeota archaeon]|jgi:hypothetical protein|nr:hypothetical protein [Candidatus Woesearchaeota archaeon]